MVDDLLFYANNAKLLNNYKKISKEFLKELIDTYHIDKKPENFVIEKRATNYFVHNINKIKENYKNQLPYKLNIEDDKLYKTSSNKNVPIKQLGSNTTMYEKDLCKEIWFASYYGKANYPFDIIDIQTPLKPIRSLKYGELDLVGVDIDEKGCIVIYLIEAKPISTNETLLRAVIESITYRYIIEENKDKFIDDFKKYMIKYEGNGKKANTIKSLLLNEEKVKIRTKTMILVPEKLYLDHVYSKTIYKKYRPNIDFYCVSYSKEDLEYHTKEERTFSLFTDNRFPIIYKYQIG